MARSCAFCGRSDRLSKEHVLPRWLESISRLDSTPVGHVMGRLNRSPKLWVDRPFKLVVGMVCERCNGGWLSRWEERAKPILTPLIQGEARELSPDHQQTIMAWSIKTAMVAMLAMSEQDQPGLPLSEYRSLHAHAQRETMPPLSDVQCWIGQYRGNQRSPSSIWVVPQIIDVDGAESINDRPSGYAFTLVLGHLLVHGFRFTNPLLRVNLRSTTGLVPICPGDSTATWPPAEGVDDVLLDRLNRGESLQVEEAGISISPFRPALDLPPGELNETKITMLVPCGKHFIAYPASLALKAVHERIFHVFHTACECGKGYLIETLDDGAHVKMEGDLEAISERYEKDEGQERVIRDENGMFFCKQIRPHSTNAEATTRKGSGAR